MAMRKNPSRFRAIRPVAENLEDRKLLSGTVSGINTEGDAWTLTLSGPGSIRVTKQPDATGAAGALTSPSEINTIRIEGTDPLHSQLTGSVVPSGKGTGKVFFQTFREITNQNDHGTGGDGIYSIDMPDFYLGLTATNATAATSTAASTVVPPSITIPDGVTSLDFGGVDTTAFFGTSSQVGLSNNLQSNQVDVNLGTPQYGGTRIIMNTVTSNATLQNVPATTAGGAATPTTFQNGIAFNVEGRLGIFQANAINGTTTSGTLTAPAAFATAGGTIVNVFTNPVTAVIGPIGMVRIGGNATNFNVITADRLNTFFVGGETSNVNLLAANGSRNLYFGKGMDTVTVLTHTAQRIFANRGAVNSSVTSDRQINNIEIGGDVVGTTVRSGYNQGLAGAISGYFSPSVNGSVLNSSTPTAITIPTATAEAGGKIRVDIAGNIVNSAFAASVDPGTNGYGSPDDLRNQPASISARVEGTISNSTLTPDSPKAAFFANQVKLVRGPVVPPAIPEAPYSGPLTPTSLPGIAHPFTNPTPRANRSGLTGTGVGGSSGQSTNSAGFGVTS